MEKDKKNLHYEGKKNKDIEFRIVLKMKEQESTCGHFSGGDERFFFFKFPTSFLCPELFPLFALTLFVHVSSGNCLHRLWLFYLFIFLGSECFF